MHSQDRLHTGSVETAVTMAPKAPQKVNPVPTSTEMLPHAKDPLRCSSTAGLAITSDSEALPNMNSAPASTEIPAEDPSCTSIAGMAGAVEEALTTVPAISKAREAR